MARGQVFQRFFDAGDQLHRMVENAFGERHDRRQILLPDFALDQVVITFAEVAPKSCRAVAMNFAVHDLDLVEDGSDLHGSHFGVREKIAEARTCRGHV